ncbi:MAG TPA: bifunctional hydroxymethylpyrimidine kinase/phosphomethylpyrimidine kinase [Micropepsaceae bacterium]|nr:bifunctional hydroxymethylpyrimidine kinase/phosphomethylpyrimidine kinase [Micropepsaceae bacterium]
MPAPERPQARILIVAGSDSGGGAGIQADIKTVTALGHYAMTAVTAITVQDTKGVHAIHEVPSLFIGAQMRVCLDDIGADAVKTGMLHDAGVIAAVTAELSRLAERPRLVVDPVMVAKGGRKLIDGTAIDALKRDLLPYATVLTPNVPEAETLTGTTIRDAADLEHAGRMLMSLGAEAVLVKGGHLAGDVVTDVLVGEEGVRVFEAKRIDTRHTHGTGCTLASAIATHLGAGRTIGEAVAAAREFVREAMLKAPGFGAGHGPLGHARAGRAQ